METTIYYTINNGGDGSVSMTLMESQELATWDQENDPHDEGWAEDCSGSIIIESDSPITIKDKIETKEYFYLEHINEKYSSYSKDMIEDFINKFFPNGVPVFTVKESEKESWTSTYKGVQVYNYFDIFCEGKLIDTPFYKEGIISEKIEKGINMKLWDKQ